MIALLVKSGMTAREMVKNGHSRQTICRCLRKIRPLIPPCPCGRLAYHPGICRYMRIKYVNALIKMGSDGEGAKSKH